MRTELAALAGLSVLVAPPALAADADALYAAGDFAAAAQAGRAAGTPDGYVLAAEAGLTRAAYEIRGREKALAGIARAVADADRALSAAPSDLDAQLQKAVALGYRAKLTQSVGDAKRARTMMEAVLKEDPRKAAAWAALGGWHGEAVANMGKLLAATMLGAKRDAAVEALRRAVELDPGNPTYRTMYAVNLIGLDKAESDAQLRGVLAPAAKGSGGTGLDRIMRAHARRLLAALQSGDRKGLERAAIAARPLDRFV